MKNLYVSEIEGPRRRGKCFIMLVCIACELVLLPDLGGVWRG